MPFVPPPPWGDGPCILYHGTLENSVPSILDGIDLRYSRAYRDFGRGFYTTTSRRQAELWAAVLVAESSSHEYPAVISFEVSLATLAALEVLSFARADFDAEAFWSLVWRCRESDADHGRPTNGGWYDLVVGPVATSAWKQREAFASRDQFSFHTALSVGVLNQSKRDRVI